jgi:hypothetical protein
MCKNPFGNGVNFLYGIYIKPFSAKLQEGEGIFRQNGILFLGEKWGMIFVRGREFVWS